MVCVVKIERLMLMIGKFEVYGVLKKFYCRIN